MTTPHLVKPKESTCSIFPTCVDTVAQSLLYVKKLVQVSLSSITYFRNIFPESSYYDIIEDGLKLKMLMEESSHKESNSLKRWIKSAFDAIEKGYLREMIFLVCEDMEKNSILESYTFKFKYQDSGEVLLEEFNGHGCKMDKEAYECNIQRPIMRMLRSILLLSQALKELPKTRYLNMRLRFYEDKTPKQYQPKGFVPVKDNLYVPEDYIKLKIGNENQNSSKRSKQGGKLSRNRKVSKTD